MILCKSMCVYIYMHMMINDGMYIYIYVCDESISGVLRRQLTFGRSKRYDVLHGLWCTASPPLFCDQSLPLGDF